jgi:hypothetical protein
MHFTRFTQILKFPGIKNSHRDFLHRGRFDPGPLTGGPEAHQQATLAWWSERPQPWRAPARDQGGAMLRRGRGGGKEGGRTRFSPGTRRGGQLGRRMAGGEQFGRWSSE